MATRFISDLIGTLASRFGIKPAGTTGPPTSGTYRAGDLYVDSAVTIWKCIVAGTPGTWAYAIQSARDTITQASHGFVAGDVLYLNSSTWTKAKADAVATAEAVGVVEASLSANSFIIVYSGKITLSGLTAGSLYYLSDATAGLLTVTAPTTATSVVKPIMLAASATYGIVNIMRGNVVGPISPVTIAGGGTNSNTALNNNRLMYSSGGAILEMGAMTNGQVVVGKTSDAPQIVTMSGDATISNTGVVTVHAPGDVKMGAYTAAPSGWLLCDGTSYLRADYAALFAAISTAYGAADGTHFNVPDLRGRVPVGKGTGTGGGASGSGLPTGGSALTARALGDWTGKETHTLTAGESGLVGHNHTQDAHYHSIALGGSGALLGATSAGSQAAYDGGGTNGVISATATNQAVAGATASGAHENMQPMMCLNFFIKI